MSTSPGFSMKKAEAAGIMSQAVMRRVAIVFLLHGAPLDVR